MHGKCENVMEISFLGTKMTWNFHSQSHATQRSSMMLNGRNSVSFSISNSNSWNVSKVGLTQDVFLNMGQYFITGIHGTLVQTSHNGTRGTRHNAESVACQKLTAVVDGLTVTGFLLGLVTFSVEPRHLWSMTSTDCPQRCVLVNHRSQRGIIQLKQIVNV